MARRRFPKWQSDFEELKSMLREIARDVQRLRRAAVDVRKYVRATHRYRRVLRGIALLKVAEQYTTLSKRGRSWVGRCPIHEEITPSLRVFPERRLYHCYGCGKGGSVIDFVMRVEGLPRINAVRFLERNFLPKRRR
jgi:hypothetical protein